jgi:hypothetical protein
MATLVPGRGCTLCGGPHLPSRCSELNIPPPEGLPNPDGGGKRAGNPEPDEDDCLRVKSLVRKAAYRVVNINPNC